VTATVTYMPTRCELRLRRSAAKHAARIAGAATPQQRVGYAKDEVLAFMAQNPGLADQVAAELAEAQAEILTRARAQARRGVGRRVA
jgi:hypothetical protein